MAVRTFPNSNSAPFLDGRPADQYGVDPAWSPATIAPVRQDTTYQQPLASRPLQDIPTPSADLQSPYTYQPNWAPNEGPQLPTSTASTSNAPMSWQGGVKAGASSLANLNSAMGNVAVNQFNQDTANWNAMANRYWLNPSSDVRPDLDALLSAQPSRVQSLQSGQLTGGAVTKWGPAGVALASGLNPIGGIAEVAGGEKWRGVAEYSGNKAGQRALEGLSAGWQGAIAGAIIGAIEGIWTWGQATKEDAATKRQAQAEFEAAMKEWTTRRNKARAERRSADYARKKQEEEIKKAKKSSAARTKREAFLGLINMANESMTASPASGRSYVAPMLR